MPATTPRGLSYPLSSDPPAGHTNMQTLATNVDQRLSVGGSASYTTDVSGNATITHGLGRVPLGFGAIVHGSTLYLCNSIGTPTSTNLQVVVFRRDTGAAVASTAFIIRWVAY